MADTRQEAELRCTRQGAAPAVAPVPVHPRAPPGWSSLTKRYSKAKSCFTVCLGGVQLVLAAVLVHALSSEGVALPATCTILQHTPTQGLAQPAIRLPAARAA